VSRNVLLVLGWILVVLGVAAVVIGVIYFTVAADKLPGFLGHIAGVTTHRHKRGIAALAAGVLLLIAGGVSLAQAAKRRRHYY
jgi:amino acid permease